jgi:hypothetical protein
VSADLAWRKGGAGAAASLWQTLRRLQREQASQIRHDRINRRVYSSRIGREVAQRPEVASLVRSMGFIPADLNFTRPIVDALWARIGNNQPAIKMAASGAKWNQRRKARQLDQVIEGTVESLDIAAKASQSLRAALVVRGGILEVGSSAGRIYADKVPCEEILMDEEEARYGEPRQMHRVMTISKEVLTARYPDKSIEIDKAKRPEPGPLDPPRSTARQSAMVEVAKSWHLPSEPDADDGRWAVSIDGTILDDGPWKRQTFPFAIIRGMPPMEGDGFWPASLVDDLANLQYQVNSLFRKLQENAYHTATLKVLVRRGAQIAKKHLAGQRPHYVEVDNPTDAVWHVPDPFPPSQLNFLEFQIRQMYEVSGVSQLMAQSKNPLGAGASGAALAEFYDIESERFSQLELAYARFWRDIGRLIIEAAQDMADDEEFRKGEVKWAKQSVIHKVAWKDVDLDADQYELHLEPTGFLPNTRAGKMQVIETLVANGYLDQKWAISLADFPDLKRANQVLVAPLEWALWALEQVDDVELTDDETEVDEEKSAEIPAPDPNMDLDLALALAKATYQMRIVEGTRGKPTPEPILERHRTFLEYLDTEKKKLSAAAPMPAPGPAMPGMDPMAGAAPMPMNGAGPMPPGGEPPMLPPPAPGGVM